MEEKEEEVGRGMTACSVVILTCLLPPWIRDRAGGTLCDMCRILGVVQMGVKVYVLDGSTR